MGRGVIGGTEVRLGEISDYWVMLEFISVEAIHWRGTYLHRRMRSLSHTKGDEGRRGSPWVMVLVLVLVLGLGSGSVLFWFWRRHRHRCQSTRIF